MSEGTLVVGDLALPIDSIRLRRGMIELVIEFVGPSDLPDGGTARLHSPDGHLVVEMQWSIPEQEARAVREAPPHGRVTLRYSFPLTYGGSSNG